MRLESNIPSGPIADKWDKHRFNLKLVNPANKRKTKNCHYLLISMKLSKARDLKYISLGIHNLKL